jgi:hypothetical protein
MIADLWRESSEPSALDEVKSALTRYLEMTPPSGDQRVAWERIASIEREQSNWLGFVNTQVHIAELPGADISTVSAAVNTFNSVRKQLDTDPEARRAIAKRLAAIMEPKIMHGDATDCSRLAWVLIQSGRVDRALEIIDCGLRIEPTNEHCLNLKEKFGAGSQMHLLDY